MSYTYIAFYQLRDADGRFTNFTQTPSITALDINGNNISGPAIVNLAVGLYKLSVTQNDLEDVIFRLVPHVDDQANYRDGHVINEKNIHILNNADGKIDTIDTNVDDIETILGTPANFMADVSAMALETTLTTISGSVLNISGSTVNIAGDILEISGSLIDISGSIVTIESIPDTLADDMWHSPIRTLTFSPQNLASITNNGDSISLIRGDTFIYEFTNIDIDRYEEGFFTIKENYKDLDSESLIMVSSGSGLVYLNGTEQTAGSSLALGEIITSGSASLSVKIQATGTKEIPHSSNNYDYDFQIKTSGSIITVELGEIAVVRDVTNRIK